MDHTETMSHVKNGFRKVGAWLLGFAWLCLVFGGVIIGFFPSNYPRPLGWLFLAVAAVVLVATADHWVKAFPGIMGVATFNSLITISSGHATGAPTVLISHATAILTTMVLVVGSALSLTFRTRSLSVVDRVALLALPASIVWGVIEQHNALLVLSIGIGCLFFAWTSDRIRRRDFRLR
jgi:hypothetical protein